jgi:hypothetical protein
VLYLKLIFLGKGTRMLMNWALASVADPHHFDADPDPAFLFDANPYPAFRFDRDPVPAFLYGTNPDHHQSDTNMQHDPPLHGYTTEWASTTLLWASKTLQSEPP